MLIVKCIVSVLGLAGLGMIAMSCKLVALDPELSDIAGAVIDGAGIPRVPFLGVLGAAKVLMVASEWGCGPFPKWLARLGLIVCCLCAAVGHSSLGHSTLPPLIMLALVGVLFACDAATLSREATASFAYEYGKED